MLRHDLSKLVTMHPHVAASKVARRISRSLSECLQRWNTFRRSSFTGLPPDCKGRLSAYLGQVDREMLRPFASQMVPLNHNNMQHRFDLLGSGWTRVEHGMTCFGFAGHRYGPDETPRIDAAGDWLKGRVTEPNLRDAQRIWQLVDVDYTPIDWHIDFKSGYRWSETRWYRDVKYGHFPGVDVKVPWELARMQHLPRLALTYLCLSGEKNQQDMPLRIRREFRNQVLDFIATNPPGFGVNWACTMDVAIRVANWLTAYDLFQASGVQWDDEFDRQFCQSVYEHGSHIFRNLEWSAALRSNHYLADIVGLLFVAAYLPSTPETDTWLSFAVREMIAEVQGQFTADGANFEASTSYHRLSAEMVAYGTALVIALGPEKKAAMHRAYDVRVPLRGRLKLPPLAEFGLANGTGVSPFPPWYVERLRRMAEFVICVTKPNGRIHQVGDNDSGRFLKLRPILKRTTVGGVKLESATFGSADEVSDNSASWIEDHLDHRSVIAAIAGLFPNDELAEYCGPAWLDAVVVRSLLGAARITDDQLRSTKHRAINIRVGHDTDAERLCGELDSNSTMRRYGCSIPIEIERDFDAIEQFAYEEFGLYVWRSDRFYMAVRCGNIGQNGNGGHAHNDQLAVELNIDGHDVIADAGTGVYTPDPELRNRYRSAGAHFVPHAIDGREPAELTDQLFTLADQARAECLYFGPQGFVGRHFGFGRPVYRRVRLTSDAVLIEDFADQSLQLKPIPRIVVDEPFQGGVPFSPGYGAVLRPQRQNHAHPSKRAA